ncbi:hypothetical protein V8C42DRAFT_202963 [Trichoderma barbatum]
MPPQSQNSHSCVACARRKIECDTLTPCSSCSKSQAACIYKAPVPSQRRRTRLAQHDLSSKIQELESILHDHGSHLKRWAIHGSALTGMRNSSGAHRDDPL